MKRPTILAGITLALAAGMFVPVTPAPVTPVTPAGCVWIDWEDGSRSLSCKDTVSEVYR